MTLSGDATGTVATDTNGNYTFTGLSNGSYMITPGKAGYTFTPLNRPITINGANVTGQNLQALPQEQQPIQYPGLFCTDGAGDVAGVMMTLSGDAAGTVATDANGNYTFTGLSNGSYMITPGKAGYTFTPLNRSITINGANVTGQKFTGIL